jgi:hypothetical protein
MKILSLCKDFILGWIEFTQETLRAIHKSKENK